jgi:hypothetical protein
MMARLQYALHLWTYDHYFWNLATFSMFFSLLQYKSTEIVMCY